MLFRFGKARVRFWGAQLGWGVGGVRVSERPDRRSIPASRRSAGVARPRGAKAPEQPLEGRIGPLCAPQLRGLELRQVPGAAESVGAERAGSQRLGIFLQSTAPR